MTGEAVFAALLLAGGLGLFLADASVRSPRARLVAVALMAALTAGYVAARFQATLPTLAWTFAALWPWLFLAFEMLALAYEQWTDYVLLRVTDHSAEADAYERRLRAAPQALPTVDVFIATYNEGPGVLGPTVRAARGLDYPAALLKVWVLDDGRRPWLRAMCRELGVGYLARPTNEHGKAGNLNHALRRTAGEFVLPLDADFVVRPDFLYRTLGFLLDRPDLGLVQTPQHFRNPDPVQHNLLGSRAWTEEQHYFMTVAQPARDAHGNAFCVGTGFVVRRSCLDELGGFPQETICEDLELSYALLARGRRTLYLNEPLSHGLAPESVPEYVKQRVRWCCGTVQQAFVRTGPLRGPGLSLFDRLFYLEGILYWLTFPFVVLLLVAPAVFWFTGVPALECRNPELFMLLAARWAARPVARYWLSERKVLPVVTTVAKAVPAFHLTAALLKSCIAPFATPFRVTLKGETRDAIVVRWPLFLLFTLLAGLLLGGMLLNLTGCYEVVPVNEWLPLNVGWTLYSLVVVILCALVCVELPKGDGPVGEVVRADWWRGARAVVTRLLH